MLVVLPTNNDSTLSLCGQFKQVSQGDPAGIFVDWVGAQEADTVNDRVDHQAARARAGLGITDHRPVVADTIVRGRTGVIG